MGKITIPTTLQTYMRCLPEGYLVVSRKSFPKLCAMKAQNVPEESIATFLQTSLEKLTASSLKEVRQSFESLYNYLKLNGSMSDGEKIDTLKRRLAETAQANGLTFLQVEATTKSPDFLNPVTQLINGLGSADDLYGLSSKVNLPLPIFLNMDTPSGEYLCTFKNDHIYFRKGGLVTATQKYNPLYIKVFSLGKEINKEINLAFKSWANSKGIRA